MEEMSWFRPAFLLFMVQELFSRMSKETCSPLVILRKWVCNGAMWIPLPDEGLCLFRSQTWLNDWTNCQFSIRSFIMLNLFFFAFFFSFFFLFFNFTILYWFCHISKWIRHRYTCVPHPEPSSLPIPSLWVNGLFKLVTQTVKSLPAMQKTQVWSLNWEDPLQKGIVTHFSNFS